MREKREGGGRVRFPYLARAGKEQGGGATRASGGGHGGSWWRRCEQWEGAGGGGSERCEGPFIDQGRRWRGRGGGGGRRASRAPLMAFEASLALHCSSVEASSGVWWRVAGMGHLGQQWREQGGGSDGVRRAPACAGARAERVAALLLGDGRCGERMWAGPGAGVSGTGAAGVEPQTASGTAGGARRVAHGGVRAWACLRAGGGWCCGQERA